MSQPISILLCALGGEGGGVLADWLIEAARHAGYPAQATSIPGVAQRTGATTYYLEVYPQRQSELGQRRPVLGLNPLPGRLDLLIASELLEATRQVGLGLSAPERTVLISASNRVLTTHEKMSLGDGRLDPDALIQVLHAHARVCHVLDMAALTRSAGTVVSAVMLGCIAACGVLPFRREDFEAAVGLGSASQQASLRGFALGFEALQGLRVPLTGSESLSAPLAPTGLLTPPTKFPNKPSPDLQAPRTASAWATPEPTLARVNHFSTDLQPVLSLGYARLLAYQDRAYADAYLARIEAVLKAEQSAVSEATEVSQETARWLALWMAFDDIVRVAELKSRASRLARVQREVKAQAGDVLKIYDHFKPGVPEMAGLLPPSWAQALLRWDRQRVQRGLRPWAWPLKIGTHSVLGMLALRGLAQLKFVRRWGQRYADEQQLIEVWLQAVRDGAAQSGPLGLALAQCGRLIKGYGDSHARGRDNLLHILRHLGQGGHFDNPQARAAAIQSALQAALRDEAGSALDASLRAHGAPAREVKPQPIFWQARKPPSAGAKTR